MVFSVRRRPPKQATRHRRQTTRGHFRPLLELLEARTLLSVTIAPSNNHGQGYTGISFAQTEGFVPPDSQGAAGPSSFVETVNQSIAIYTSKSTGTAKVSDTLENFYGVTGNLPPASSGSFYADPVVTYDDNMPGQSATNGRFFVLDTNSDFGSHISVVDIAVSKSANPQTLTAADWNFYQVSTTENGGTDNTTWDADYPGNLGYNQDAFFFTLNMFPVGSQPFQVQVGSLSANDLLNGVPQSQLHIFKNDITGLKTQLAPSIRPATEHDAAAGAPEWLMMQGAGRPAHHRLQNDQCAVRQRQF
jgi:hypothetical protein